MGDNTWLLFYKYNKDNVFLQEQKGDMESVLKHVNYYFDV